MILLIKYFIIYCLFNKYTYICGVILIKTHCDFNRLTYIQSRKTKKLKLWKQIIVEIF
jgi:hypothetical protein